MLGIEEEPDLGIPEDSACILSEFHVRTGEAWPWTQCGVLWHSGCHWEGRPIVEELLVRDCFDAATPVVRYP
jgi:hypothetical protein